MPALRFPSLHHPLFIEPKGRMDFQKKRGRVLAEKGFAGNIRVMEKFIPTEHPHRRYNALNGDWVLVSPHRTKRPWQGQTEPTGESRPSYDPTCYLCPGNTRANGEVNPDYQNTFVFENDFAALLPQRPEGGEIDEGGLFKSQAVSGVCRVICFHPRHDLTLAQMSPEDIGRVIETWQAQTEELGKSYRWVQVFENKGAVMGCSNPHPHGQVWASDFLPLEPSKEDVAQRAYKQSKGSVLLLDYAREEAVRKERVVVANEEWLALVPYWAVWPYEILLVPRRPALRLTLLDAAQKEGLADAMKRTLVCYDKLFQTSFPYSMGWHGAPFDAGAQDHWQLHAHFFPPLLRSASVKKFMVGYEMLGEPQRDLTPEQAAGKLRELL